MSPNQQRRARSPANQLLTRIASLAKEVRALAADWLDDHGPRCSCCFCSRFVYGKGDENQTTVGESAAHDLRGLAWAAEIGESLLFNHTLPTPEEHAALLLCDVPA